MELERGRKGANGPFKGIIQLKRYSRKKTITHVCTCKIWLCHGSENTFIKS